MRILLLSDLHHELWRERAPEITPSVSRPDFVILAGDIDTGAKAVAWAAATFRAIPVLYVHGNHEAYGRNLDDTQDDIRAACAVAGNVHFLDCGQYLAGSVRFLGATLWTDFCLFGKDTRAAAMRQAEAVMNDYRRIRLARKGYRKLRAPDTAFYHTQQRAWLEEKLAEPFDGTTVVITHMAPSMQSVVGQYEHDLTSAAYASRLEGLASKADLWVHGHMHESFDYMIGACRVVTNPCGYILRDGSPENARFDPNFVIELPGPER
jgi:predicted phosphodiesterase